MTPRRLVHSTVVLSFIAGAALCLAAGRTAEPAKAEPNAARKEAVGLATRAGNRFAVELFRRLDSKTDNVFYSPWSVATALDMARAGARGKTHDALTAGLSLTPDEKLDIDSGLRQLRKDVASNDPARKKDEFVFTQANRLWASRTASVHDAYAAALRDRFNADSLLADFSKPKTVAADVNAWVSDKTNRLIRKLIDETDVPDDGFILTNAVYFHAKWSEPFNPKATKQEPFIRADGTKITTPMMHKSAHMAAAEIDLGNAGKVTAVRLDYEGPATVTFILPEAGKMDQLIAALDIDRIRGSLSSRYVDLALPKLSIDTHTSLKAPLIGMGMGPAFETTANFEGAISIKPTYITNVLHAAALRMDEEKTEAAGATSVLDRVGSPVPSTPLLIRLDRPFLLAITHEPTGAVLFMGRVNNPMR